MTIAAVLSGAQRWHVEHGEALEVLRSMPDACVDAIVTDPPAGIAFMGKTWDHDHGGREGWVRAFAAIFRECLRVLKPGGRAFVWSIPRTSHWTACAVEDAGFVIENTVAHVFGSGFPKGKGQLKPAREDWILCRKPGGKVQPLGIDACRVEGAPPSVPQPAFNSPSGAVYGMATGIGRNGEMSHAAGRWPPNLVLSHVDGCVRVGEKRVKASSETRPEGIVRRGGAHADAGGYQSPGRVQPMNGYADADGLETVADWRCQDGCPVKLMGEQSGERPVSGAAQQGHVTNPGRCSTRNPTSWDMPDYPTALHNDTGTAARFFPQFEPDPPPFVYFPKASRRDRNSGLSADIPARAVERSGAQGQGPLPQQTPRVLRVERNTHPTAKNTALMRWLIRLITPPGGLVLDCFAGSGSTVVAALTEGCRAIGVEREAEYVEIARARAVAARIDRATRDPTKAGRPIVAAPKDPRQRNLFGDES